ncbi:MAG: zinc ribbon domain-containing protein [Promethearchaeota archaeon]|nr:MAG: zinc ribbon domain-containing protein [Candidatus Lokiarchaeota archaeon]
MPISDEEYNQTKAKLTKRSKTFLTWGGLVLIAAITMIVLSFVFSDFGPNIALMIPAFFMLFIGIVLCMISLQLWYATKVDKITGYMSKATGDSAKYTTEKVTDGFATGLERHGMSLGGKETIKVKCRNCGYLESEDAEFCSKCGQSI